MAEDKETTSEHIDEPLMHEPLVEPEYRESWLERMDRYIWSFPKLTGQVCAFCVQIRFWLIFGWVLSNAIIIWLILGLVKPQ